MIFIHISLNSPPSKWPQLLISHCDYPWGKSHLWEISILGRWPRFKGHLWRLRQIEVGAVSVNLPSQRSSITIYTQLTPNTAPEGILTPFYVSRSALCSAHAGEKLHTTLLPPHKPAIWLHQHSARHYKQMKKSSLSPLSLNSSVGRGPRTSLWSWSRYEGAAPDNAGPIHRLVNQRNGRERIAPFVSLWLIWNSIKSKCSNSSIKKWVWLSLFHAQGLGRSLTDAHGLSPNEAKRSPLMILQFFYPLTMSIFLICVLVGNVNMQFFDQLNCYSNQFHIHLVSYVDVPMFILVWLVHWTKYYTVYILY